MTDEESIDDGPGLRPATRHWLGLVALVLIALVPLDVPVLPFPLGELTILKITGAFYVAVFAMSWDAVSGYTGEISFGHALFFGVGGYTSGLLNVHHGVDLWLSIPAGVVMAAVAGLVIGVPALRVRGPYLSLITLVAPIILLRIFVFFSDVTGGETGLVSVGLVDQFTFASTPNYYIALGVFVVTLAVLLAVTRSDAGDVFTAIREDEDAVAAAGLNPSKYKIFAFVLSGTIGGLGGAVFAHSNVGGVTPSELLSLTVSIEVIIATILGGIGTITGAAVGGMVLYLLGEVLRSLNQLVIPVPLSDVVGLPDALVIDMVIPVLGVPTREVDLLLFGGITLLFLFFVPEGILPRALRIGRRIESRLRPGRPVDERGRTPLGSVVAKFNDGIRRLRGGDDE